MSQPLLPFAVILFDLDGTLIDSARDVMSAVNVVLRRHRLEPIDDPMGRSLMGEGGRVRMRKAFALRGIELGREQLNEVTAEFVAAYEANPVEHTRPYDGVPDVLRILAGNGIRLGVCTNKYESSARDILARLDLLSFIDDVAGADTFDVRKPDPGHLLKLLDRMRASGSRAAMVGDSIHDIRAARAAGLPCIAVSWGYTETPAAELGADAVIDRFDGLLPALAGLAPEVRGRGRLA